MQFASRWLENLRERRIGSFYFFPYNYSLGCFDCGFSGKESVSYRISKILQFSPPTEQQPQCHSPSQPLDFILI